MRYVTTTLIWWGIVLAATGLIALFYAVALPVLQRRLPRHEATTHSVDDRQGRCALGLCAVCGEPSEPLPLGQPSDLCRYHWLRSMADPLDFERMRLART